MIFISPCSEWGLLVGEWPAVLQGQEGMDVQLKIDILSSRWVPRGLLSSTVAVYHVDAMVSLNKIFIEKLLIKMNLINIMSGLDEIISQKYSFIIHNFRFVFRFMNYIWQNFILRVLNRYGKMLCIFQVISIEKKRRKTVV